MAQRENISGNIRNPQGGGLEGVTVQLINADTGALLETEHSIKDGYWEFIRPGTGKYNVLFSGRNTTNEDDIYGIEIVDMTEFEATAQYINDTPPSGVFAAGATPIVHVTNRLEAVATVQWVYTPDATNKHHGFVVRWEHGPSSGQAITATSPSRKIDSTARDFAIQIPADDFITIKVYAYYLGVSGTNEDSGYQHANWIDSQATALATVSGWESNPLYLSRNNATLHSDGYLSLGSGNDIARLDAAHATYRQWIGHADPASAPFSVTKVGLLAATGVNISGEITATSGAITGTLTVGTDTNKITIIGTAAEATTAIYAGAGNYGNADTGFYADASGRFSMGTGLTWSGSVLNAAGHTLDPTEGIYAGTGVTRVQMKPGAGFWAGATTQLSAPFYAQQDGKLVAAGGKAVFNSDGSGTLGSNGIAWTTGGIVDAAGWILSTDKLLSAAAANPHMELDKTLQRISVMSDATTYVVSMGYLSGLAHGTAFGTATSGSASLLTDTGASFPVDDGGTGMLAVLNVNITAGTGSPQTRTISANTATTISASFSPAIDGTSVYNVSYTTSDYGFWAKQGDKIRIDGEVQSQGGSWLVGHDQSFLILNSLGNTVIRLGTDTGEKGLFFYTSDGATQQAKFYDDKFIVGTSAAAHMSWNVDIAGQLAIDAADGTTEVFATLATGARIGGAAGWEIKTNQIVGLGASSLIDLASGDLRTADPSTGKAIVIDGGDNELRFYNSTPTEMIRLGSSLGFGLVFDGIEIFSGAKLVSDTTNAEVVYLYNTFNASASGDYDSLLVRAAYSSGTSNANTGVQTAITGNTALTGSGDTISWTPDRTGVMGYLSIELDPPDTGSITVPSGTILAGIYGRVTNNYSGMVGDYWSGYFEGADVYIDEAIMLGTGSSRTDNGTLRYTGTDFEGRVSGSWASLTAGSGGTFSGLSDTTITGIANLDILLWSGAGPAWINVPMGGDATIAVSGAVTIGADKVTYAKMQNVIADDRILGNIAGAGGIVAELTKAQVLTMLNVDDGADVTGSNPPQAHTLDSHTGTLSVDKLESGAVDAQMLIYNSGLGWYTHQTIGGDISITNAGVVTVANNSHTHIASNISSGTFSVARGGTGLATMTSGYVLTGAGASNVAMVSRSGIDTRSTFPPSSHAYNSHTGAVPIADIAAGGGDAHILAFNAGGVTWASVAMSGDVTITNAGVTTVANNSHTHNVATGGTGVSTLDDIVNGTNGGITVAGGADSIIGGNVTLSMNISDLITQTLSGPGNEFAYSRAGLNRKVSFSDMVDLMDGTGLTATSGVLAVDASQSQITTIGTLVGGTVPAARISAGALQSGAYSGPTNFTISNILYINESANTGMTLGATINQATNTDEILALKQTSFGGGSGHGMTALAEADTFSSIEMVNTNGAVNFIGYGAAASGMTLTGRATSPQSGKSAAAIGIVNIRADKKSGTGIGALGSSENLVSFQAYGSTRAIIDAEGDLHLDGTSNINVWDEYDDVSLLTAARSIMMKSSAQKAFQDFIDYGQPILEKTGVITYNDDGHHFVSMKGMMGLISDTIRQMNNKINSLEAKILQLEA